MNGHPISKLDLGYHHPFILFAGSGSDCSLGWALLWKILTLKVNRSYSKETGHTGCPKKKFIIEFFEVRQLWAHGRRPRAREKYEVVTVN